MLAATMEEESDGVQRAAIDVDSFFLEAEGRMDPCLLSCLRMLAATMEEETDGVQRAAIDVDAIVSFILDVVIARIELKIVCLFVRLIFMVVLLC